MLTGIFSLTERVSLNSLGVRTIKTFGIPLIQNPIEKFVSNQIQYSYELKSNRTSNIQGESGGDLRNTN
jgi:hypothetical protein